MNIKLARSLRRFQTVYTVGTVVLITSLLVTMPSSMASASQVAKTPDPSVVTPITGAVTGSAATWVNVVMGKSEGQFNFFWQLLAFHPSTGRYALATPPGVADNGGLTVATNATGTTALAGFGPSQDLAFSPLAFTVNTGKNWGQGGLSNTLDRVPSDLALGTGESALALVNNEAQTVLQRSGSLTDWKTLVTRSTLAKTSAGSRCEIHDLSAVAVTSTDQQLLGASCQRSGVVGIFVRSQSTWHLVDTPLHGAIADDSFAVVRLEPTSALLATVHGTSLHNSRAVVAAWQQRDTITWTLSAPLTIRNTKDLVATGTGPGTTQFVLIRAGQKLQAWTVAGPGAKWHLLPMLPTQTASLAITPAGQIDALSVKDTLLSVWKLNRGGKSWSKVQTINVPIAFGSSA